MSEQLELLLGPAGAVDPARLQRAQTRGLFVLAEAFGTNVFAVRRMSVEEMLAGLTDGVVAAPEPIRAERLELMRDAA